MALSIALYAPLWWRIFERGTSGDISLVFQVMLWVMQLINLVIAYEQGAKFFKIWYWVQLTLVTATGIIVYHFHD